MVKEPFTQIDSEFDQICMDKLRLDVKDLIHANEHT